MNRKMWMDKMHSPMSAILLKAAKKYIGLKAVAMSGRCWMTKWTNGMLEEREAVCRSESSHTKVYDCQNEEVSWPTMEVKQGIWQRNVLEARRMSEM